MVASITHGPGIDDPLIVRYNGVDYYYHKNHQGSVTEILNSSGGIVKTYRYDAFGKILSETGPAIPGGFTYTGREFHTRSGLYYYRFRFYDPSIGRFISEDPIGPINGTNLYAYTANSPVLHIDPLGLQFEETAYGEAYTILDEYYSGMYDRAHELRSEAWQSLSPEYIREHPEEASFDRHYNVTYQLTLEYGSGDTRLAGFANEWQGWVHDVFPPTNFLDSIMGNRQWGFSLTDLFVNEIAIENAQSNRCPKR
ncbi:RHS repeat-associated core domain-containing protein [Candidatus Poribacteria bacterium]|nr:RHS repeat-associated core domain-containing protein [Candidatus Poribacteria bacterium]